MALVDYSDSEAETEAESDKTVPPPAKKRKTSNDAPPDLPPLPQSFRDLYSSTVRTSTQDDPSLHGGRKRVTPHVAGNWPTHVYLEWCPSPRESDVLAQLIDAQSQSHRSSTNGAQSRDAQSDVQSLLQNDLGVSLPLHVSLSRPLVLKTEQKDDFLLALKDTIGSRGISTVETTFEDLQWHPNEDHTRWFLVLRVAEDGNQMLKLLGTCNGVAADYNQPRLYEDDKYEEVAEDRTSSKEQRDKHIAKKFHISIAWSLNPPPTNAKSTGKDGDAGPKKETALPKRVLDMRIPFGEVKVRIGQDVTSLPLGPKRRRTSGVLI